MRKSNPEFRIKNDQDTVDNLARRGVAAELELDVGQVHVQEQGRADPAGVEGEKPSFFWAS